ncbi:MAG: hypothetical protein FWH12_09435 [Treponema sp.]|nr:hypothetical protein [Treponema sp.]
METINTSILSNTLSFVSSSEPDLLHWGILRTVGDVDQSILALGLALYRVKTEKLYKALGYKNLSAYMEALALALGRDRSCVYKWLKIGKIYVIYQKELSQIGFSHRNGPTKLPYLERALERGPQRLVFTYLMEMNQRDFAHFAKTGRAKGPAVYDHRMDELLPGPNSPFKEEKGKGESTIYYQEAWAVRMNSTLSARVKRWLRMSIQLAFNALDRKGSVTAVHLDSERELKLFNVIAHEARVKMREDIAREKKLRARRKAQGYVAYSP